MKAMIAHLNYLVLLALFLLASHANAFTSLSLVAENQVQINHLICLQQPASDSANEPIRKFIKQMKSDAELPNIQFTIQSSKWIQMQSFQTTF